MSTNVPTISVTPHLTHHTSSSSDSDSDTSNSHDNDMNYSGKWGESTDVEDFGSQADIANMPPKSSSKNHLTAVGDVPHDVTDVEDYDASDSELEGDGCDKEHSFPELKLSLEEFLNHDLQALQSVDNEAIESVERRSGNFLQAQNLTTNNDYLTDCEDYHTDSEIENECVKSVCLDLNEALVEPGCVNIADATGTPNVSYATSEHDDVSIASNISDLAMDTAVAKGQLAQTLSEDEVLEISGDEEVCHIAFSDSDSKDDDGVLSEDDNSPIPHLDVAFIPPLTSANRSTMRPTCSTTSSCKFLAAEERKEEVLTDIERLDDDDDDDSYDDDEKPIPQAVILTPGDAGECLTDYEDVSCDENSCAELYFSENKGQSVDSKVLPLPQREVVLLHEDKYGDTITSVMPMDEEYQFGMGAFVKEQCATDSEEYSCADDEDGNEASLAEPSLSSPSGLIESDITIANEQMKAHISKRLEIQSNTEAVTDVEEFYMDGTNVRRKKLKTRSMSKNKSKYLDVPKAAEEGKTDTEDMDLSETELPPGLKYTSKSNPNINLPPVQIEKATDIEDLTADDISSASEVDLPQIDRMKTNLKDYDTSSSNVVIASEACASSANFRQNKKQTQSSIKLHNNGQQQPQTDTEDVQLPSDAEDINPCEPPSTCLSNELHEMLNAGCTTTVHEKCQSSFNVDAEKIHIKGMLREAHTDVEYVESDESAARGSK
ncbi:uncharacterized protein isoform X4 [Musca autumnalis]|uniref:uncharacterized protein isoform X4 n=1 Tax=Musca autumnalis TaxID=221902 RepID=UPI003CF86481